MTSQQQARALGDPTRHGIYRQLIEARRPVPVIELAERAGVSQNAVRQHLAKLVDAGLVLEGRAAPAGRGRPRLTYQALPGSTGAYERLAGLLIEVIRTGDAPEDVGRRAADLFRVPVASGDVAADVRAAMDRQGFDAEVRPRRGGAEVVLHTCPFESAVRADRAVVCSLHLGIADGLVDGSDHAVEELVANDPSRADCRIRLCQTPVDGEGTRLTFRP